MERLEVITAKGEGIWGNQKFQVAQKTQVRAYYDSLHLSTSKVLRYLFTFGSSISNSDRHFLCSDEERRKFVAQPFVELSLDEIPDSNRKWNVVFSPWEDCLQLEFSPYGFFVYNWPNIFANGRTLQFSDQGYRGCLLAFIGKQPSGFDEYLDKGLVLLFSNK